MRWGDAEFCGAQSVTIRELGISKMPLRLAKLRCVSIAQFADHFNEGRYKGGASRLKTRLYVKIRRQDRQAISDPPCYFYSKLLRVTGTCPFPLSPCCSSPKLSCSGQSFSGLSARFW